MRWYKVSALLWQDFRVMRRTKFHLIEIFLLPVMTILVWSFFALFARAFAPETGVILLIANIYWSFASGVQGNVNQLINIDVWSRSVKQIFASGISKFEYLAARLLSTVISEAALLAVLLGLNVALFGIAAITANLGLIVVLAAAILLASFGVAGLFTSVLLTLGREYTFLGWTANTIFIFLSAPYFPVSVFPPFLQAVAAFMPYTAVFEAIRAGFSGSPVPSALLLQTMAVGAAYFLVSLALYRAAYERSRRTGTLARMD